MTWVSKIFEIVIFPLLGVGTVYLINLINVKIQELKQKKKDSQYNKYLDMLNKAITDCVIATTQTYVESLKKQGAFDAEAQKNAFNQTYSNVLKILSDDAKTFLEEALGDLETYIYNKIESEVNLTK